VTVASLNGKSDHDDDLTAASKGDGKRDCPGSLQDRYGLRHVAQEVPDGLHATRGLVHQRCGAVPRTVDAARDDGRRRSGLCLIRRRAGVAESTGVRVRDAGAPVPGDPHAVRSARKNRIRRQPAREEHPSPMAAPVSLDPARRACAGGAPIAVRAGVAGTHASSVAPPETRRVRCAFDRCIRASVGVGRIRVGARVRGHARVGEGVHDCARIVAGANERAPVDTGRLLRRLPAARCHRGGCESEEYEPSKGGIFALG
jgi:hypothetical protein